MKNQISLKKTVFIVIIIFILSNIFFQIGDYFYKKLYFYGKVFIINSVNVRIDGNIIEEKISDDLKGITFYYWLKNNDEAPRILHNFGFGIHDNKLLFNLIINNYDYKKDDLFIKNISIDYFYKNIQLYPKEISINEDLEIKNNHTPYQNKIIPFHDIPISYFSETNFNFIKINERLNVKINIDYIYKQKPINIKGDIELIVVDPKKSKNNK